MAWISGVVTFFFYLKNFPLWINLLINIQPRLYVRCCESLFNSIKKRVWEQKCIKHVCKGGEGERGEDPGIQGKGYPKIESAKNYTLLKCWNLIVRFMTHAALIWLILPGGVYECYVILEQWSLTWGKFTSGGIFHLPRGQIHWIINCSQCKFLWISLNCKSLVISYFQ